VKKKRERAKIGSYHQHKKASIIWKLLVIEVEDYCGRVAELNQNPRG